MDLIGSILRKFFYSKPKNPCSRGKCKIHPQIGGTHAEVISGSVNSYSPGDYIRFAERLVEIDSLTIICKSPLIFGLELLMLY